MQTKLFNILKRTPEYKQFKSKSQMRSIAALITVAAFWALFVAATDFSNIDDVTIIYFGILILATILLLRYAYRVFFKCPAVIIQGTIIDIKERRQTVNEGGIYKTRITYQYLVHGDSNDYWGDCVYDFIEGRGKKHNIGETVLFFSMSPGNGYIVNTRV